MSKSLGVPIKLLHEAQGHIVTIELKLQSSIRGKLHNVEDNMNMTLKDITLTSRDGQVTQVEQVYIRGSNILLIVVPDMLCNAPMFRVSSKGKGIGLGRGKATVMRAQALKGRMPASFTAV